MVVKFYFFQNLNLGSHIAKLRVCTWMCVFCLCGVFFKFCMFHKFKKKSNVETAALRTFTDQSKIVMAS